MGFIAGPEQGYVRVPLPVGDEQQRSERFFANTSGNSNGGWTKVLQDLYESTTTTASITTSPSNEKAETDKTQAMKWREIVLPEAVAFSNSLSTYFTEEEQPRLEQDLNRTIRISESSPDDVLSTTVRQDRYFSYTGSSCAFEYVLLTRPGEPESSSFELVIFGPGGDFGRRG